MVEFGPSVDAEFTATPLSVVESPTETQVVNLHAHPISLTLGGELNAEPSGQISSETLSEPVPVVKHQIIQDWGGVVSYYEMKGRKRQQKVKKDKIKWQKWEKSVVSVSLFNNDSVYKLPKNPPQSPTPKPK